MLVKYVIPDEVRIGLRCDTSLGCSTGLALKPWINLRLATRRNIIMDLNDRLFHLLQIRLNLDTTRQCRTCHLLLAVARLAYHPKITYLPAAAYTTCLTDSAHPPTLFPPARSHSYTPTYLVDPRYPTAAKYVPLAFAVQPTLVSHVYASDQYWATQGHDYSLNNSYHSHMSKILIFPT